MKRLLICVFAVMSAANLYGIPPRPASDQAAAVALTGATIHVGDGSVIEQGTVTFADGVITGVYQHGDAVDLSGYEVLDKTGEHLYPGFVLPNTRLGLREVNAVRATLDDRERGLINASVRSLPAYNTDSELIPTYRFNGVLTAQVTPRGSLIAGNSSIVQLDAWNWEDAAIQVDDAMHVYWPVLVKRKVDAIKQLISYELNANYEKRIAQLDDLFAESQQLSTDNLNVKAVQQVLNGERQFFIHAEEAKQLADALQFIARHDIPKPVLVGAREALQVKDLITAAEVPVIVQFVHGLPAFPERDVDESYHRVAKFVEAGFKVGLAAKIRQEPASDRNLPFQAGTVAAYGLGSEQAVQLITLNNAEILGIDDKLGSIAVGKFATLFTSSGDALDMRSNNLTAAFIQGREVRIEGMQQELYERFKQKYSESD